MFKNAFIPYGGYYTTPFCKWQGSLQSVNSIELGGKTAKRWFEMRGIDQSKELDYLYMGITNGQQRVFYGATWLAHMMGAGNIPGNTIMHACATSTTTIYNASLAVEKGNLDTAYCLLVDRMSNGPHTIWPNPQGPGGEVVSENWNMDNINCDPSTGFGMIVTAENVARENGFTKAQADELTLRRYEQYVDSLKDDRAFQKKYMFPVEIAISRKQTVLVEADEGVTATSKEAVEKLRPVMEGGIHSYANQTHPADGNAGVIVTTKERAAQFSTDKSIPVQVISYGCVRAKKAFMPAAPAPAARLALQKAGLTINDIKTVKNHNPFIANDLFLAKELGIDAMHFNNYGSSLVFGHPQAPTLARLIMEAIEETVLKGGGYALVTGCAAGDSAACLIVKVG